MDERLSQSIDAFIEKEEANIWRDIARLVAINSVEGEKAADAPFGEGPKKALEEGLKIARELGLEAHNCEGHMGYAVTGGDGDRYLATITQNKSSNLKFYDGWINRVAALEYGKSMRKNQ